MSLRATDATAFGRDSHSTRCDNKLFARLVCRLHSQELIIAQDEYAKLVRAIEMFAADSEQEEEGDVFAWLSIWAPVLLWRLLRKQTWLRRTQLRDGLLNAPNINWRLRRRNRRVEAVWSSVCVALPDLRQRRASSERHAISPSRRLEHAPTTFTYLPTLIAQRPSERWRACDAQPQAHLRERPAPEQKVARMVGLRPEMQSCVLARDKMQFGINRQKLGGETNARVQRVHKTKRHNCNLSFAFRIAFWFAVRPTGGAACA